MKNMYKLALLAALGLVSVTAAQAQTYNDGDLLIGFASSTTDYVVDLGQVPPAANTTIGTFDLSSAFGSTPLTAGVSVGIIGADPDGVIDSNGALSIWTSLLRTGTSTSYSTKGTETAPTQISAGNLDNVTGIPSGVLLGKTGTSAAASWTQEALSGGDHINWSLYVGNPTTSLTSSPLTLDVFSATDANNPNSYTYDGAAQITLSGSTATVVWDPSTASVPEPATYGLLSGAGMLLLGLRRQFSRKA